MCQPLTDARLERLKFSKLNCGVAFLLMAFVHYLANLDLEQLEKELKSSRPVKFLLNDTWELALCAQVELSNAFKPSH